jgi:hypothetical protein
MIIEKCRNIKLKKQTKENLTSKKKKEKRKKRTNIQTNKETFFCMKDVKITCNINTHFAFDVFMQ